MTVCRKVVFQVSILDEGFNPVTINKRGTHGNPLLWFLSFIDFIDSIWLLHCGTYHALWLERCVNPYDTSWYIQSFHVFKQHQTHWNIVKHWKSQPCLHWNLALAFIHLPEVLKMEHRTSVLMEAQMARMGGIGSTEKRRRWKVQISLNWGHLWKQVSFSDAAQVAQLPIGVLQLDPSFWARSSIANVQSCTKSEAMIAQHPTTKLNLLFVSHITFYHKKTAERWIIDNIPSPGLPRCRDSGYVSTPPAGIASTTNAATTHSPTAKTRDISFGILSL